MKNSEQKLIEAKNNGDKLAILNGFKESVEYIMSLSNLIWVGETKSDDGYSMLQCFETDK